MQEYEWNLHFYADTKIFLYILVMDQTQIIIEIVMSDLLTRILNTTSFHSLI